MFGNNPLRNREAGDGNVLGVHSIFDTIQGEGPYAGTPATFVRLWGCNLRCYFCDTDFESVNMHMPVDEIVGKIRHTLVVLTGGEPMRQPLQRLIRALVAAGRHVQIETAGTLWFDDDDVSMKEYSSWNRLSIVVSPKTPTINPLIGVHASAYKYLMSVNWACKEDDGLPICNTQSKQYPVISRPLARPPQGYPPWNIYVQPLDESPAFNAANSQLCVDTALKHNYRLSLQQHKIVGLP